MPGYNQYSQLSGQSGGSPPSQSNSDGGGGGGGLIGGIIGSVGGIVSNIVNRNDQMHANRENNKQFWFSKMYDNWYNSPSQQMERLKAAGLNPNLVYGSGANVPASGGSPPERQAPRMDGNAINAGMHSGVAIAQLANLAAQKQLTEAQTRNVDADTKNKPLQGLATIAGTASTDAQRQMAWTRSFAELSKMQSENDNIRANTNSTNSRLAPDIESTRAGTKLKSIQAFNEELRSPQIRQQTENLLRQFHLMDSQKQKLYWERKIQEAQFEYFYKHGVLPTQSHIEKRLWNEVKTTKRVNGRYED